MILDNHEDRIRYYELILQRRDLSGIPQFPLPEGFTFVFYRPGDEEDWIRIEISARELADVQQGREVFLKYYGGQETELVRRMVFLVNPEGKKIATATAWWDIRGKGPTPVGMLHWVAVAREAQGLGLARCLISRTLSLMAELGHTGAVVPTQTTTWVACKLYLDFGFLPIPRNLEHSRTGWCIMRSLTDHPALDMLPRARLFEMFRDCGLPDVACEEQSAGAVIVSTDRSHCLLVRARDGFWGLPKGHLMPGETPLLAARREILEETGLFPVLVPGIRRLCIYTKHKPGKCVTYFLAFSDMKEPCIQDRVEIAEARWMDYASALLCLHHEDQQECMRQILDAVKIRR